MSHVNLGLLRTQKNSKIKMTLLREVYFQGESKRISFTIYDLFKQLERSLRIALSFVDLFLLTIALEGERSLEGIRR